MKNKEGGFLLWAIFYTHLYKYQGITHILHTFLRKH